RKLLSIRRNRPRQSVVAQSRRMETSCGAHQSAQRRLEVRDDAELDRVVSTDLTGIDVEVDRARRREAKRESRVPGAAVGFRKASAQAEDPVGLAAFLVDECGSP